MINYKYYIGIDPGVKTGFCVWSRYDKKITQICTDKIHKIMLFVSQLHKVCPGSVKVKVEDARQATFGRKFDAFKAQGAGSVKRDAKIWEDFLTDLGVDFDMVRPQKALTKINIELFKKMSGYSGTTSSHARDAAMLVVGL